MTTDSEMVTHFIIEKQKRKKEVRRNGLIGDIALSLGFEATTVAKAPRI